MSAKGYRKPHEPMTLEQIRRRCVEVGECWIWQQGCTNTGYPQARIEGQTRLVGRYVYANILGGIIAGRVITTRCGNRLCISPACLNRQSYGAVLAKSYVTGKRADPGHYITVMRAQAEAGRTKLSPAIVETIRRERMHEPDADIAADYGVKREAIARVKNRKAWAGAGKVIAAASVFSWGGQ